MQNDKINSPNAGATDFNDKKKKTIKGKFGDFVEKVGHKVSDAGAPKIGQKIHDLGDKLEDKHDNPDHPHKV